MAFMRRDSEEMRMRMDTLITQEIEEIIATGEKLAAAASASKLALGHERVQELTSITARGGQLIARLYGSDSHYFQTFKAATQVQYFNIMHSRCYRHVADMVGIFKAVEHDIKSGMLANFRSLIQAEVFTDFLDMAEHFLREDYKDAAAVLLGAVLEDSLRKVADANGVSILNAKGKPLTIDPLNVALAKKGVYNALVQKQIISWANLRNDAAHGHFDKYDSAQVQQMLLFVQNFCVNHLK